jgi:hypothetical protein
MLKRQILLITLLIAGVICIGIGVYSLFYKQEAQIIIQEVPVKVESEKKEKPVDFYTKKIVFSREVTVPAKRVWFDSGIDITNKYVRIQRKSGTWSNTNNEGNIWSEGWGGQSWGGLLVPNGGLRDLVGKTSKGMFVVGQYCEGDLGSGRLYLSMNDIEGHFNDNVGSIVVTISFLE